MELSKNCGICGTVFYKTKTKSLKEWNKTAKYCSRKCSAISIRDVTIARNISNRGRKASEETRKKISLAHKGRQSHMRGKKHKEETKIKIRNSTIASQTPEVRLKKSLAHRGHKSHNWKGGRTSLKHRMRTLALYTSWRNTIFERDGYTCVHCGDSRGGNLEADHIITVERIFNAFVINTIDDAINNFLLWETANGRTLCKPCHIKRHKRVV